MNIRNQNGLEIMTKVMKGELPMARIAEVIPMKILKVEKGKVVFSGIPSKQHENPAGGIHGGFIATLIDSATGCAVHTVLEKGEVYGTIELNVKMLRPLLPGKEIFGEAEVINRSKRLGVASCIVKDKEGKIFGTGSATCMIDQI